MIGESINRYRKKSGLTQIEMANLLNVHKGTISLWETNRRTPDIETLIKIAKIFKISLDELCSIKQENHNFVNAQQKSCIDMIMQLDDELLNTAEIYLTGLSGRSETFVIKKMR